MSESYEREKMGAAVGALACSADPIQKRLENAWMAMHTLRVHGFIDSEAAAEFEAIDELLTADKSDEKTGYVPTTCSRLSDDDASAIARRIVDLDSRLNYARIYALEDELRDLKRG